MPRIRKLRTKTMRSVSRNVRRFKIKDAVTADTITDEMIRDYARDHWRDPWPFATPDPRYPHAGGTVGDAEIIAFSTSHPESRRNARSRFALLINALNACKELP